MGTDDIVKKLKSNLYAVGVLFYVGGQAKMNDFGALYEDDAWLDEMTKLIAPRVERFVQRLMGITRYEYSDGRYPGFSSEIISFHYPLRDDHIEHINRVIVGHLMLRCEQLAYFSSRLNPTLLKSERDSYDEDLQALSKLFRGEDQKKITKPPEPLKQQLVFALAILHDVGKNAFMEDSGHEERAGKLVEKVLDKIKKSIGIDNVDVSLGRVLIENHTMLGTLVQGERSAWEVREYLNTKLTDPNSQEMFFSYLLLLNSMDLSGYRSLPILLDHYFIEKYMDFSNFSKVQKYANEPLLFAKYRLCMLARSHLSDFGDIPDKESFCDAAKTEFGELKKDIQDKIGRMWVRDALYFIFALNKCGTTQSGGYNKDYAILYVKFFKTLAEILIETDANIIAYRLGNNGVSKTDAAKPERLQKFSDRFENNDEVYKNLTKNSDGIVEFTINEEGLLVKP